MTHLARIARDVGNPNLISDLHNAIQTRVAFLFVRGSDGFVLKPVSEAGTTGVVVWIGWGGARSYGSPFARSETPCADDRGSVASLPFSKERVAESGETPGLATATRRF